MTKREAYNTGKRVGLQAAKYCEVSDTERREAGCECSNATPKCRTCGEETGGTPTSSVYGSVHKHGPTTHTFVSDQVCADCLTTAAYESEQNARQYSPWEFLAHEINSGRNPEGQWEAYDAGVAAGIKLGVTQRLKAQQATK